MIVFLKSEISVWDLFSSFSFIITHDDVVLNIRPPCSPPTAELNKGTHKWSGFPTLVLYTEDILARAKCCTTDPLSRRLLRTGKGEK